MNRVERFRGTGLHGRTELKIRLAILFVMIAVGSTPAQERYKLDDLQALDRRQDWDELLRHLKDISPSQRGPVTPKAG